MSKPADAICAFLAVIAGVAVGEIINAFHRWRK